MKDMSHEEYWGTLSELYAFLGNSLLKPMTQTAAVGLDADFWKNVPSFGNEGVREALDAVAEFAHGAVTDAGNLEDAVMQVSIEYTHLFIGPPAPAVAPWETMYRGKETKIGFGEATHEMREELRQLGLEVSNANNQYADHMGIELLCLSEICHRVALSDCSEGDARAFAERHPVSWITAFRNRVMEDTPDGYIAHVLGVAEALLLNL